MKVVLKNGQKTGGIRVGGGIGNFEVGHPTHFPTPPRGSTLSWTCFYAISGFADALKFMYIIKVTNHIEVKKHTYTGYKFRL